MLPANISVGSVAFGNGNCVQPTELLFYLYIFKQRLEIQEFSGRLLNF